MAVVKVQSIKMLPADIAGSALKGTPETFVKAAAAAGRSD